MSPMLDPTLFATTSKPCAAGMANRGLDVTAELQQLATLGVASPPADSADRGLKREQNTSGDEVARAKRQGEDVKHALRGQQGAQPEDQADGSRARCGRAAARRCCWRRCPNLPHASVPVGKSAADNVVVRTWGEPRAFDFEPKAHWDLGPQLGIIDFERATKISGARFAVLMGAGAQLERALINFMLHAAHRPSTATPRCSRRSWCRRATLYGTGQLPKFEQDLFKIAGEWDLYLIPTAEVPVTNLYRGEILDGRRLPLKYTAYTPCFRSEAGSYGADVRGLDPPAPVRQGRAREVHDARDVVRRARKPDRECGAGAAAARPAVSHRACCAPATWASRRRRPTTSRCGCRARRRYREISSCSNCEAFQARRANIKFRPDGTGKAEYVHTLNGSGLAVGRTLIAILENYQQTDGSVVIPEALRPFMGGRETITK